MRALRLCVFLSLLVPAVTGAAAPPADALKNPAPESPVTYVVTGTVTGVDRKPAAGARVWLSWAGRFFDRGNVEGKADAQGRFRLRVTGTAVQFLALGGIAPGAAPTWKRLPVTPKLAPVSLRLQGAVTLSARLTRTDGSGMAGVRVAIEKLTPQPSGPDDDTAAYEDVLLPGGVLKEMVGQSARDGRFQILRLSPGAQIRLKLSEQVRLAEGSPPQFRIRTGAGVQDGGTLVVVAPGSILAQVQTPEGRPVPGASARLRRILPAAETETAEVLLAPLRAVYQSRMAAVEADASGLLHLDGLQPGRYELAFHGRVFPVDVAEGAQTQVKLAVRTEPLAGRVVDADGKPASGCRVEVEIGRPRVAWPPSPQSPAQANTEGAFQIGDFPWGAPLVVIRARKGDALAEWSGDPASLPETLSLTLKPGLLVTVKGRALGPSGQPLANANLVLAETASERAVTTGASDSEGRFVFEGVPRGLRLTLAGGIEDQVLVGPASRTPDTGASLDLGDVRLEPSGTVNAERLKGLAAAFSLTPMPAAEDLAAGRDLAFEYLQALRAGDFKKLHALTSSASPTYARDLTGYMRKECFRLPPEAAGLRKESLWATPVVPRLTFALLFGVVPESPADPALALLNRPDWMLIGYPGPSGVNALLIAHRDPEGWRALGGLRGETTGLTTAKGDQALFGQPYPAPAPEPLLAAARKYFDAWSAGDPDTLRALTSPEAVEYAAAPEPFARNWAARTDGGRAPEGLRTARPEADTRFSRWDLAMLLVYPRLLADVRAGHGSKPRTLNDFPYPQVRAGDVAVLRYQAGGKQYLMLLVRRQGAWEVLEPALPA